MALGTNDIFPDLPGLDIRVGRTPMWKTTTHTSPSGVEDRTAWQSAPRYRYTLNFRVLRTNTVAPGFGGAYSEVGVVLAFINDHLGSAVSFLFVDPLDGVQRRVRFETDSLDMTQEVSGAWSCSFNLLTTAN